MTELAIRRQRCNEVTPLRRWNCTMYSSPCFQHVTALSHTVHHDVLGEFISSCRLVHQHSKRLNIFMSSRARELL